MYRYLLLLTSMLGVSACSPSNEVAFDPSVGDEHTYWTYSNIEAKSYYGTQQSRTSMRQQLKVTDTSPLTIVATSDYVDVRAAGSHRLNSLAADSQDEKMMRLFSKGFELTVDTDSGKLQDFRALDDELWQEILKKGGKEAIDQFTKSTLTPGVLKTIPTTVGATVALPEFAGQSVSLTVKQVTDDEVTTEIEGHDEQGQPNLYGVMVLEREDGWLKQLMLVTKQYIKRAGQEFSFRSRVVMLPGDQPGNFDFDNYVAFDDWQPTFGDDIDQTLLVPPTGEALLPYSYGVYQASDDGPELVIPQELRPYQVSGTVKLKNIQGLDAKQQPIDVEFQWANMSQHFYDLASRQLVIPIGWNKQAELERLNAFTATAEFYPRTYLHKTVQWQAGEQHIDIDGATITIKPLTKPANTYEMVITSTADTQIANFMKGLKGEYKEAPHEQDEFLSYSERVMFNLYSDLPQTEHYLLRLKETPTEVTFYASQQAKSPTFSRDLTFIKPEEYQRHPEYPPLFQEKLYGYYSNEATKQQHRSFDDLRAIIDSGQGSYIDLPKDWQKICQLKVLSDYQENGHGLAWVADNDLNSEPFTSHYRLSTDDGIRHYFYGISVTSELSCEGDPSWQAMEYQPSDKPWLVPVAELDGIDLQQPLSEFVARYHLLNDEGEPLNILLADGQRPSDMSNTKLADALTPQQQLRVAGRVSSIQHLSYKGTPLKRQWTNTFPALP
ncbi:hypothetical protein L9G15_19140 [Shewanella sp. A3A]|nr:hypothetical protein [Shewanella ferrihydritica]